MIRKKDKIIYKAKVNLLEVDLKLLSEIKMKFDKGGKILRQIM